MKSGKRTLLIAIAITTAFASCRKPDNHSYICRCTGNSLGPVETYKIESSTDDDAREQCKGFAQAPGADSTTCALD